MHHKPLICLDFDGVVHSYNTGWSGAHIVDCGPVLGALDWLRDAYLDGGVRVAIHSSRSKWPWGRWAMKAWLRDNLRWAFANTAGPNLGLLADEIMDWLEWPWFKPPAVVTIDDRALTFNGRWEDYDLGRLLTFKPWNRRGLP